jgi:hypothetical protein
VRGAVLLVAAAALYAYTEHHISQKWSLAGHALAIPTDSLTIARGRHGATAISRCSGCHQRDFGGQVFIDIPPVAFLYAANLTRGRGGIGGAHRSRLGTGHPARREARRVGAALHALPRVPECHMTARSRGAELAAAVKEA